MHILFFFIALIFLGSCTSERWMVKEKESVDQSEYKFLEEHYFLQLSGEVSPENPVLTLDLYAETYYEYPQRVLMQRTIQDYRLRPGAVVLGAGGAAMAFYVANATDFGANNSNVKKWTLNGIGALMLASGFLNMKPVGEPQPTGEERYLRNTGTTIEIDTVNVDTKVDTSASVYILYNNLIIFEDSNEHLNGNSLNIPLGNALEQLELSGPHPGKATVEVLFADSLYRYSYPVSSVLQPYAQVTNQITALRNSPEEKEDNILADLVQGSQLRIADYEEQEDWYKVLYGISETYIKKSDASIIWHSEDYETEDQIVTVPRVPFGDIDVESNIPILLDQNNNARALLVINQSYNDTLEERNYALRDGRLLRSYLENALGYPEEHIYQLADIHSTDSLYAALSKIKSTATDSTELFIYLSGYGLIKSNTNRQSLQFLPVPSDTVTTSPISLLPLFKQIGQIPSAKTLVLSDIDFSHSLQSGNLTESQMQKIIEENASPLITGNQNTALLMGTRLNYPSSLYVSTEGEDKKHHIFPYFFAKALQQRRTTISDIYQYLERNVSYTSRRLFDRPQNPLLIGNTQLDLIKQ